MYTSIPHDEFRNVISEYLELDHHLPPVNFLLDLVDLLLEKNYFRYKEDYFLQVKGVSMGSYFAPCTANLFMAKLEDSHILNEAVNPFFNNIVLFFRFIDDFFCVYKEKASKNAFIDWFNGIHDSIKFTSEGSTVEVNFLDMAGFRTQRNTLAVKPFVKPTDKGTRICILVHTI